LVIAPEVDEYTVGTLRRLLVAHPGQRLGRLDAAQGWISKQRNRASYSLWFATSLKLLWDGLSDYLA
jgi:hypothetical protein